MKQVTLAIMLGVMFVLTGCPLNTTEPIDNGSYTATGWLVGKWVLVKQDGTSDKGYLIKKGSKPGQMEVYDIGSDGKPDSAFRPVIFSLIGNDVFLSAYEKGDELTDPGYYILKLVKKTGKSIDLVPVKEYSVSSESNGPEIREWLKDNANGDIYEVKDAEHYKKD